MTHRRAAALREFVKVGLANENRTGSFQPSDDFSVLRRHTVLE